MKPTKMRNQMIYRAGQHKRSKQLGSNLSPDLQKKYNRRSARVVEGDSVTVMRGEFKTVDGRVSKVATEQSCVAIEGMKKEKPNGDKFDVYIHTSNLMITSLNTSDKWRMAKLEGKDPGSVPKDAPKDGPAEEADAPEDGPEEAEAAREEPTGGVDAPKDGPEGTAKEEAEGADAPKDGPEGADAAGEPADPKDPKETKGTEGEGRREDGDR